MQGYRSFCIASILGAICFSGAAVAQIAAPVELDGTYVGSEICKQCHEDTYNDFRVSGHPYKLKKAADVQTWPIPLPKGWDWTQISYVIGGYKWKSRYMDKDGYIITSAGGKPGKNQYNLATGEWVDYHAGEKKPYNCGSCHTTGFDPTGHQGGLQGIEGTWAFEGVQCEQCHGMASAHVAAPSWTNIKIDRSAQGCGACHVRDNPRGIPAKGGFIRHHEQYNEMLASPHNAFNCIACHDPHKKGKFSIKRSCTDCHKEMANPMSFKAAGQKHLARGIECKECHMPYAAKSAVAFGPYKADVRSHLFKITTNLETNMFDPTGTKATGVITGEYSCLGCHEEVTLMFKAMSRPDLAVLWARYMTSQIHW